MFERKLERVEPDSPRRCQGSGLRGQCPFAKYAETDYCLRHGGDSEVEVRRKNAVKMFRLGQYQGRVNEFVDNDQIKSLREEIGILRISLEQVITGCQSPNSFAIQSGKISMLVAQISKLVQACHRLEISTGQLLDKNRAIMAGEMIVAIISEVVTDPDSIAEVSERILQAILNPPNMVNT